MNCDDCEYNVEECYICYEGIDVIEFLILEPVSVDLVDFDIYNKV